MKISATAIRPARKKHTDQAVINWDPAPQDDKINSVVIEKVIKKLLAQLPGLAAVAIVETATGRCLAHLSRTAGFDAAAVATHNAALVRHKQLAMSASSLRGERLTDILIPFRKQLHLIRLARGGQWFGYLAIGTQEISLALAREILQSIIP
ncbi:hypothetical protein GCM10027594_30820 [Hymenobacter agri]